MENKKTIAVVDDQEPIREFVKEFLTFKGYDVETYENGLLSHEAIESEEINPSLILTDYDYKIPEINGLGFLEKYAQKFPCIMMTGDISGVKQKALDLGAKIVLEKPFNLEELVDVVNKYSK